MSRNWIQVGESRGVAQKFDPFTATPEDIHIEDIALALSHVNRYGGHTVRAYSVAEHAVRVRLRVAELGGDFRQQRWALLHDATEAYLGDVCRPLKHRPEWQFYRDLEARLGRVIAERFGLVGEEPDIVKAVDSAILSVEARDLKQPLPLHPEWELREGWSAVGLGWTPERARHVFLAAYADLFATS